jgi:Transposase DDE domain
VLAASPQRGVIDDKPLLPTAQVIESVLGIFRRQFGHQVRRSTMPRISGSMASMVSKLSICCRMASSSSGSERTTVIVFDGHQAEPMTSGLEARGRFGKQDFVYLSNEDAYRCPAGEKLIYHYTNEEDGQQLRRYWTNACRDCALKASCTTGKERRITRWEHEHVLEEAQRRLDNNPHAKARMGATHFSTKTLPKVAAEMALSVLAYI